MPDLRSQFILIALTVLLLASCHSYPRTGDADLIGRWREVGPENEASTMVFTEDGELIYSIHSGDRTEIINLVYEVSGDQLITDQPSSPRKEISKFYFEPNGILVIDYQGEKTRFMRER